MAAPLPRLLDRLETRYGPAARPPTTDPFELVLLENVVYLASDEQRAAAFAALRERIGTTPRAILAAEPGRLREIAGIGGILPDQRVGKLIRAAEIARDRFGYDVKAVLGRPAAQARKELQRFPSLGEPGAEKVLLFTGAQPVLALESNGLRVLLRLGFGQEKKTYAASYRAAQAAAAAQLPQDCVSLTRAHLLLRRHGQELCRRSRPRCEACPLAGACAFYRRHGVD